ncbi:MAG: nuclease, partial [Glaciihabitans sp.]|nr:nuclease [Glaciihabitans sp.]
MPATHSAADEAARYKLEAEQSHFIIATAWRMHRQYAAAADTEARLGLMLGPLEQQGFRVLSDRLWPRSTRANVDFVLVGPTGVIIVDAKSWVDVSIVDDRVFQCNDDVTDRFANLGTLAEAAQKQLAEIGMAPGEVRVVAVFMGERNLRGRVAGVDLISEDAA